MGLCRHRTPDRARRRAGNRGIDEEDRFGVCHAFEEPRRLAVLLEHVDIVGYAGAQGTRHDEAHGVIAAIRIADADDQPPASLHRIHPRSISSRRKCVAQEMQGS